MDPYTDIEGFSHRSGSDFDAFHESINKSKPVFASECCSTGTERGDTGISAETLARPAQA